MKKTPLENLKYAGEGTLETIPCPLCGGNVFKTLVIEQTIPIVRCRHCDLVFANPRPAREGLLKFYAQYFPPESAPLWQKQMSEIFAEEGFKRLEEFRQKGMIRLSKPPRLLDIGCGMGFFLDLMRSQGWAVKGVEPAPEAARYAREKLKLDLFEGTIEEAIFPEPFDAVTLWYVMEHVPDPDKILERAGSLLKPGGVLVIRVPNQNAPIDQWLARLGLGRFFLINPPRHLFDYSPKTLARFLEKYGFEVLKIRNGIPRKTGTWLELIRRYLWFWIFEGLYHLSAGKIIRGSSMTVYARKK